MVQNFMDSLFFLSLWIWFFFSENNIRLALFNAGWCLFQRLCWKHLFPYVGSYIVYKYIISKRLHSPYFNVDIFTIVHIYCWKKIGIFSKVLFIHMDHYSWCMKVCVCVCVCVSVLIWDVLSKSVKIAYRVFDEWEKMQHYFRKHFSCLWHL